MNNEREIRREFNPFMHTARQIDWNEYFPYFSSTKLIFAK